MKFSTLHPALCLFALLASLASASAATKTWNGSTTGSWQLATNWNPSGVPVNGDALVFPNGAVKLLTTNAPGGPTNFASLSINGDGYTLRSPSLVITNGLTNAGPASSANTIFAPVSPARSSTWTVGNRSTLTLAGNLTIGNVTLAASVGGTLVLDGNVNGAANSSLRKEGRGRLEINGTAVVANLDVTDGTLLVDGQLDTVLAIASGATLAGSGTVPAFTCDGVVSPGLSGPGRLTVSGAGAPVFDAGSSLVIQLNGTAPGTGYDQLSVTGPFDLSDINLVLSLGFVPVGSPVIVIITNRGAGSFTSAFPGLPEGSFVSVGSELMQISYTGGTGNDVTLTRLPPPTGITRTWSGGAVASLDLRWSNPNNWVGNSAPLPGDSLVFPASVLAFANSNNLPAGTVFNLLTISNSTHTLNGNAIILRGGIQATYASGAASLNLPLTLLGTGGQTVNVAQASAGLGHSKPVTLAGPVTKLGAGRWNPFTVLGSGGFDVSAGQLILSSSNTFAGTVFMRSNASLACSASDGLGLATAGNETIVENGAEISFNSPNQITPEPLELAGVLRMGNAARWAGPITVSGSNAQIISGTVLGTTIFPGSWVFTDAGRVQFNGPGSFVIEGDGSGPARPLFDLPSTDCAVNGQLGVPIRLGPGSVLRGTGEVGSITNEAIGNIRLIPGFAGGTLTCSNLAPGSPINYVAEILGATYGQLRARGSVKLTNNRLTLAVTGPVPLDQPLVIIDNLGAAPVIGTFLGLANNALISTNGQQFRINYDGGDGNDVTLTRVLVPSGVTRIWDAGGVGRDWGNPTNWNNDILPGSGDDLVFPSSVVTARTMTNSFPADYGFNRLWFGGDNLSWNLFGKGVKLLGGIVATNAFPFPSGSILFRNVGIELAAAQTWSVTNVGMIMGAPVSFQGHTLTIRSAATDSIRFKGEIVGPGEFVAASGPVFFPINSTLVDVTVRIEGGVLEANQVQADGPAWRLSSGTLVLAASAIPGLEALGGELFLYFDFPSTIAGNLTMNGGQFATFLKASTNSLLTVTGAVTLHDAVFFAAFESPPPPGTTLTLIDNTGANAVTGTFAGLPEGAAINIPDGETGQSLVGRISYVGGDGNDVTLTVLAVFPPPSLTGILCLPNGLKQLTATGVSNRLYVIEATTNLLDPPALIPWEFIGTRAADGAGQLQFIDTSSPTFPQRFYRTRLAPQ